MGGFKKAGGGRLKEQVERDGFGVQVLRQVLETAQPDVLGVSGVVHPENVVALLLPQGEVQLVGGHVNQRLLPLHRRLHLHVHLVRPPAGRLERQPEVEGPAALPALVAPQDGRRSPGVAAVPPLAEEGVDQLLPPFADDLQVGAVARQRHLQRTGVGEKARGGRVTRGGRRLVRTDAPTVSGIWQVGDSSSMAASELHSGKSMLRGARGGSVAAEPWNVLEATATSAATLENTILIKL